MKEKKIALKICEKKLFARTSKTYAPPRSLMDAALWKGEQGKPFPIDQDTWQGGIPSTSDFKSHLHDNLDAIEKSDSGFVIGSIDTSWHQIAVTEDMILLAPTLAKLHAELDLACSFPNRASQLTPLNYQWSQEAFQHLK